MKITNTQPGPRGVNSTKGPVLIDPGQSWDGDVYEREREHLEASGWFTIEGDYKVNPADGSERAPMNDDKANDDKLEAANRRIAGLETQMKVKDGQIADLTQKLADATKPVPGALAVLDKGRGWFAIVKDGAEVTKSLREDDVKYFDKLSDSDKLAFVDLHKPE